MNDADADRTARAALVDAVERQLGPFDARHKQAMIEVDRRAFVRPRDQSRAYDDTPLPLDDTGDATISAPHAYLLTLRLLELGEGDRVVELGSGSGYGAALASTIVGPRGAVRTIEIDPALAAWSARTLAGRDNVSTYEADAVASIDLWGGFEKVACTFAIDKVPEAWLRALPDGGVLVAPVGPGNEQRLVRVSRDGDTLAWSDHGGVRYVKNRA
jgi:protein-L-isoaspartate(D-aspartate) O-methyltransferase